MIIDVEKVKLLGIAKYVNVGGEIRFVNNDGCHAEAIKPGDTPKSAGTIGIHNRYWNYVDTWSMTLKVGRDDSDIQLITDALGLCFKDPWI